MFRDDPDTMLRAVAYVQTHRMLHQQQTRITDEEMMALFEMRIGRCRLVQVGDE